MLQRAFYGKGESSPEERALRAKYQKVMRLAEDERAISQGAFFDLMYVNGVLFQKQYAWLRKFDDEVVLIVVNFSGEVVNCEIAIPEYAFEVLSLCKGTFRGTELLTNQSVVLDVDSAVGIPVVLNPYDGVVIKWVQE